MDVHVSPILNLPPHPITQGHPSAPALSALSHASDLDWRSISHVVIYMFQCCSLKSSHSCLLPQSPTVKTDFFKMWYIYTLEYYLDIKRNEIVPFVEMWMDLETVTQSKVSQKILYVNAYVWNLEKWCLPAKSLQSCPTLC